VNNYNFSSSAANWIGSYLSHRFIKTFVKGSSSNPIITNRGVPQGGCLSPLLFNLYINDISVHNLDNSLILYADDILLFSSGLSQCELLQNLYFNLNPIIQWYSHNDLQINTKKSKFLILSTSSSPIYFPLKVGSDVIFPSDTLKYLGCTLDKHLNFNDFVSLICNHASHRINLMKSIFKFIKPVSTLFYCYYIIPILEIYSSILFAISTANSNKLELIQNRALKIISGIKFNQRESLNLSSIRTSLDIPLLSSRRTVNFATKIFKSLNNLDPILSDYLQLAPPLSHRFHLRNKSILHNNLSTPKANKMNYGYKCFDKLAASLWNPLPPYLKTCATLQNLKKNL